jgi:hypothetical protein
LQQKVSESARSAEDHDTAQDSLDISDPRLNMEPPFQEHSYGPIHIHIRNTISSDQPSDLESQQSPDKIPARPSDLRLVDDDAMIYFSY